MVGDCIQMHFVLVLTLTSSAKGVEFSKDVHSLWYALEADGK